MRPRLLDLFCGAGGAAMGYHRAGFDVVGVDINPQPNYPFEFHQGDAVRLLEIGKVGSPFRWIYTDFEAIHASPPCQDHSALHHSAGKRGTGWLLEATLELLRDYDVPWVVENVVGAPLPVQPTLDGRFGVLLCGAAFGLGVDGLELPRHRLFETSFPSFAPPCSHHDGETFGVYGHGLNSSTRKRLGGDLSLDKKRQAMSCEWMSRDELSQAIPPAFTEFIGMQLLAAVGARL